MESDFFEQLLGAILIVAVPLVGAWLARRRARQLTSDDLPRNALQENRIARSGSVPGESSGQGRGQALAARPFDVPVPGGSYLHCPETGRVVRDVRGSGYHVRLDLTPQVLSLSIPDDSAWQSRHLLFRTNPLLDFLWSLPDTPSGQDLVPTCPQAHFVSASMLAFKAKLFDDGLYAAAEIAAQPGKVKLLAALADVAPPIAAAACLGGIDVPQSADARRLAEEFLADELASKPLGFYTFSDVLRRIFQQDRLLQRKLTPGDANSLAAALADVPALSTAYEEHLDAVSKLTNPPPAECPDLRQPGGRWFFPPSRSLEGELAKSLFGDAPIPEGFSLADEIVRRLRNGTLRLDPNDTSGWYDFQAWALEALVLLDKMPEGARMTTDQRYREQLEELFKAVLSLNRETHVKQVEVPPITGLPFGVPACVVPALTVEPLRTYYERRAQGYEFVRQVLERLGSLKEMHRVTSQGPVPRSLDEELAEVTAIFRGAAAVAGQELGMALATGPDVDRFREWAKSPDIAEDVRTMVPLFYDINRRKTKVWAILGWDTSRLVVSFATPPSVRVLEGEVTVNFRSEYRAIAYPVFAEAYVSRVLDRDEFRQHCDRHKTRAAILENL